MVIRLIPGIWTKGAWAGSGGTEGKGADHKIVSVFCVFLCRQRSCPDSSIAGLRRKINPFMKGGVRIKGVACLIIADAGCKLVVQNSWGF